MSFTANPFVVVLDANVFFPMRVRDILLSFADAGLFRVRFTDEIIDEWTRSLLVLKPHLEASIRTQEALIRDQFAESLVTGHMPLIDGLTLRDPDDRHVPAAAIRCSAQVIATKNLRDFPADVMAQH